VKYSAVFFDLAAGLLVKAKTAYLMFNVFASLIFQLTSSCLINWHVLTTQERTTRTTELKG